MSSALSEPADRNRIYWLEQSLSDVPAENAWLTSAERETLSRLRFPKRREDWRLGRWTAKSCIAACAEMYGMSQDRSRVEIRTEPTCAPFAVLLGQDTVVALSLTHRAGKAMCALAPSNLSVGCDIELIEARSVAFLSDYFTGDEQDLVRRAAMEEQNVVLNMLWSAKESALKATGLGLRMDTRSVRIQPFSDRSDALHEMSLIDLSKAHSCIHKPTWRPLRVSVAGGTELHGWWSVADAFVRTIVLGSAEMRLTPPEYSTVAAATLPDGLREFECNRLMYRKYNNAFCDVLGSTD